MSFWAIAALLLAGFAAHAAPPQSRVQYHAGDIFEITRDVESSEKTSNGSSGSSTDRDTVTERVVGASPAGLELEYDLPKEIRADQRAQQWQLPARALKPAQGPLQLLNRAELEARAATWLKVAGLTNAACGHWFFTWTAFRIECDPQSAIEIIKGFDLGPDDLREGISYRDPEALGPAPLKLKTASPEGSVFYVELAVDPEAVRRDRAQADVVTAEIMGKPTTLEAAFQARAAEKISGSIDMTFVTDPAGHVRRRTKVIKLHVEGVDGRLETRTVTETLERTPLSGPRAS
ncbi:MAG TPA: hypothetical protein VGF71_18685 [Caulobacteraceae bacterium]|jgi:hypothetical protein